MIVIPAIVALLKAEDPIAPVCRCACHEHPGTYPTSVARPCFACGHVHEQGETLGFRQGWRPK